MAPSSTETETNAATANGMEEDSTQKSCEGNKEDSSSDESAGASDYANTEETPTSETPTTDRKNGTKSATSKGTPIKGKPAAEDEEVSRRRNEAAKELLMKLKTKREEHHCVRWTNEYMFTEKGSG